MKTKKNYCNNIDMKLKSSILQNILRYSPVGIHCIDNNYNTIVYNKTMADLEGLSMEKVLNKDILEVFPSLTEESSTLIKVLKSGEEIINRIQSYTNIKGKEITTINSTIPLTNIDGEIIGSMEISNNMTHIKEMSDKLVALQKEVQWKNSKKESFNKYTLDDLIGEDERFLNVKRIAKLAGESSSSVLIYGETGTGKELVAQSIHYSGSRRYGPFIAQNCAAIPDTLLEGLLFGTEKGSFTGAKTTVGIFEQANGGTLLLDEINSMSTDLQAKLLRVLQENYIRRVGGNKDIPIDVRIIATTNQEPLESVRKGIIRKDLFYRLNVISIVIPLLKNRPKDIKLLSYHFIDKYNDKLNKNISSISNDVLESFYNYDWPGNVRELENAIESAMNIVSFEDTMLKKENFLTTFNIINTEEEGLIDINLENTKLPVYLETLEKNIIKKYYKNYNYNISQTAKKLGISRQSLQYKLDKYDLQAQKTLQ